MDVVSKNLTEKAKPHLIIASNQWLPWSRTVILENGTVYIEGVVGDIMRILAKVMNFDYTVINPPDGQFGNQMKNGSWTGMINLMRTKQVDMGLGPFSVSSTRASVVDFTTPVHHGVIAVVTVRPKIENDIEGFLKPFTMNVWLATMMSLVVMGIAAAAIHKMEGKVHYLLSTKDTVANAILWSVKALTQESSEWLPGGEAGRVLVTTWLLASLVFMTSYSGILTAMLTAPRVTIPIDSLEDLVAQSKMPWMTKPPGTFSYNYLKESKDDVRYNAYLKSAGSIKSCWARREELVSGKFAALCQGMAIRNVMSWDFSTSGRCRLWMSRKFFYTNDLNCMGFPKNSPYIERVNRNLHALKESGIMGLWLSHLVHNTTQCMKHPSNDRSASEINALDLEAMGGPFLLLSGGLILAFLSFFGEVTFLHFTASS